MFRTINTYAEVADDQTSRAQSGLASVASRIRLTVLGHHITVISSQGLVKCGVRTARGWVKPSMPLCRSFSLQQFILPTLLCELPLFLCLLWGGGAFGEGGHPPMSMQVGPSRQRLVLLRMVRWWVRALRASYQQVSSRYPVLYW